MRPGHFARENTRVPIILNVGTGASMRPGHFARENEFGEMPITGTVMLQ